MYSLGYNTSGFITLSKICNIKKVWLEAHPHTRAHIYNHFLTKGDIYRNVNVYNQRNNIIIHNYFWFYIHVFRNIFCTSSQTTEVASKVVTTKFLADNLKWKLNIKINLKLDVNVKINLNLQLKFCV